MLTSFVDLAKKRKKSKDVLPENVMGEFHHTVQPNPTKLVSHFYRAFQQESQKASRCSTKMQTMNADLTCTHGVWVNRIELVKNALAIKYLVLRFANRFNEETMACLHHSTDCRSLREKVSKQVARLKCS